MMDAKKGKTGCCGNGEQSWFVDVITRSGHRWGTEGTLNVEGRRSSEHKKYWDGVGVTGAQCPGRGGVPDEARTLRRWEAHSQQGTKDFGLYCTGNQKPLKQFFSFGDWGEESREIYHSIGILKGPSGHRGRAEQEGWSAAARQGK